MKWEDMKWNNNLRIIILLLVFSVSATLLCFLDPIAQDLAYHNFSDCRNFFGIPHFMDVVSNLPFLLIGFFGLRLATTFYRKHTMVYFLMTLILFTGVFFTGVGSSFYHYSPNNFSLIFDRLPMTLVFTSFFSTIVYDYVGRREGAVVFYSLFVLGVYSVLYWYYTEIIGQGDLRLYAFVQFFPVVAVPLIALFYYQKNLYARELFYVLGIYALAKLCEHYDAEILRLTSVASGHTLKHLMSGLAIYFIYRIYKR